MTMRIVKRYMVKFDTPGRQKLLATKLGPSEIARRARVNQSTVSRWLAGESRPDDFGQEMLKAIFGIERSDWLTHQEKVEQRRVIRRVIRGLRRNGAGRVAGDGSC